MGRRQRGPTTKGSQGYNRNNSEDFLSKNALKTDVWVTESGLQCEVIDASDSEEKPLIHQAVRVHQRITLIDGSIIDDTYKQAVPAEFLLEEAIPGYQEGLLMMTLDSRYRFFIPSDLAWGKRGAGKKIGPYAALIIDVRLLHIA